MTLHHIIGLAATAVFFYALWMGLIGITYILTDVFMDWYARFKQTRKNKASQNNQGGASK